MLIGLMNVAFMAIMAGVITIAVPAVGTFADFRTGDYARGHRQYSWPAPHSRQW